MVRRLALALAACTAIGLGVSACANDVAPSNPNAGPVHDPSPFLFVDWANRFDALFDNLPDFHIAKLYGKLSGGESGEIEDVLNQVVL